MRRTLLLPFLLLIGLAVAACGSSTPTAQSTTTTTGASSGGTSSTTGNSSAMPAVANPTDLSVEPVISAGTPPPPTSVQTKDLVVGTGATANASSTVLVQYVGANYATGTDFDSSWSRGQPSSFPLNGVVPGFAQGIEGMKVGGRREIVIPPAEGYGAAGQPPVGPNETLVFVVDLKGVS
jgi:peptidylprolyl isomerase